MAIWTVELITAGDYGETHFNVIAETEKEAWKKACELEDRKDIARLWMSKGLGNRSIINL